MNKLLSLVVVAGMSIAAIEAAQAIPVVRLEPPQAGLTIPVGSGCGLGVHRGPDDGCIPIYGVYRGHYGFYYRGYRRAYDHGYRDGYDDGPYVRYSDDGGIIAVDKGFCGFGSFLSCSHGLCWRFCY